MHKNHKQCKKIVIILEDSERISSDILSILIDLCYMLKSENVAYEPTCDDQGWVYVGLILCVTVSTVESIQTSWSSDRLLKTISSGAVACDVQNIIDLYVSRVDEDPSLSLATLKDDKPIEAVLYNSFPSGGKSLSLVHKFIQCLFKLRTSLSPYPLLLLPLFDDGSNSSNNNSSSSSNRRRDSLDLSVALERIYKHILEMTHTIESSNQNKSR